MDIRKFPFDKDKFNQMAAYHFGSNWPVVYVLENGKQMYIGQTTNLLGRSRQHIVDPARVRAKWVHTLTDDDFNLSSAYDFESLLIQYVAGDGVFKLQNENKGLVSHNYYERERYQAKLSAIWPTLKKMGLVRRDIGDIKNSAHDRFL